MEWFEQLSGTPKHVPTDEPEPTGPIENAQVAFGEMRRENLPVVSPHYLSETKEMRYQQIYNYIETGAIPQNVADFYFNPESGLDMDSLSLYARDELGIMDIPTPQDYERARNEEYADYRKHASEVYNAQTKWGMLGEFAGKMAAIPTDPLYAISFFTGYGSATTALQAFKFVGLTELAIEGMAQVGVKNWKDEIGSDYSGAEMFVNTLSAGLLGGGLGYAGKGVELKVGDALKSLDAIAFKSPEASSLLNPVRHVLRNSDAELTLRDVAIRDEALEKVMNGRGAKTGADPETGATVGISDRAEQGFADRVAQIEAYQAEARDLAMQATQELEVRTAKFMDDLAPVTLEKAELDALKKVEKAAAQQGAPEAAVNVQLINDRLEELNKAVADKDLPSFLRAREASLQEIAIYKERAASIPEVEKAIETLEKRILETPAEAPKIEEVSPKTQLPDEPTNPLAKEYYAKAVDIDAKIKQMEEIC